MQVSCADIYTPRLYYKRVGIMKTSTSERVTRVVFGLGLLTVGAFSGLYVSLTAYLMGLLLLGIAVYTKATEYPEDERLGAAPTPVPPGAAKAPLPKKTVRKRRASKRS
jgi:hypothetical protein